MRVSRVAVTTTAERGRKLVPELESHGMEAILLPCIEVVPASSELRQEARRAASDADWIVVTSSRAVTSVWPHGGMPEVAVAAVGRATADAVEQAGGVVQVVGGGGAGELIQGLNLAGAVVVHPHGSRADGSLVAEMERMGARVSAFPVYHTRSIPPGAEQVEAAIFGSPSAVAGWLLSRQLDGLVVAAIGKTTDQALQEHGVEADVMPTIPSYETLIPLLADHLKRSLV